MREHAVGRDGVPGDDVLRQRDQRRHLRLGEGAVAEFVPGIDQLDADRAAVHIGVAGPVAFARVPGAALFSDVAVDRAVLVDGVMRTDLGLGIAEPLERGFGRLHAGIVQQQDIDRRVCRPGVVVRRRSFDHGSPAVRRRPSDCSCSRTS